MALGKDTYRLYCRIADEWLVNGANGNKAVLKVCPDKSVNAADRYWQRVYGNVQIKKYIEECQNKLSKDNEFGRDELFKKLLEWLHSDITETMCLTLKEIKELPKEVRQLITEYNADTETKGEDLVKEKIKIKFVSKEKAGDMIAKMIGAYAPVKVETKDVIDWSEG